MREPMGQNDTIGAHFPLPVGLTMPSKAENRREPRCRSRLRSGHLSDGGRGFICNCVIRDHSTQGARLLLPPNISLPRRVWFYDDDLKKAVRVEVRWQRGQEIGILKLV
jgi:hypothetical protein